MGFLCSQIDHPILLTSSLYQKEADRHRINRAPHYLKLMTAIKGELCKRLQEVAGKPVFFLSTLFKIYEQGNLVSVHGFKYWQRESCK